MAPGCRRTLRQRVSYSGRPLTALHGPTAPGA
jgi:hypothetical protein